MDTNESGQPPSPNGTAYEPRDVAWGQVLTVMGISSAIILALIAGVAVMYTTLYREAGGGPTPPAAATVELARQLQTLRRQDDERLNTSGWVSREERIVRIPIDRAIDLWLEEQRKR
jgi:hypothetical protein